MFKDLPDVHGTPLEDFIHQNDLPAEVASEIRRCWVSLFASLSPALGSGAMTAVLGRSVYLCSRHVPEIEWTTGTIWTIDQLIGLLTTMDPDRARFAGHKVLESVLHALCQLIGPEVTEALLRIPRTPDLF